MATSANSRALADTRRASEQAAAVVCGKLARGARSLLLIGCIAPLLGMFGTGWLLIAELRAQSLPGFGQCDCDWGVAETFVLFAISLPPAVLALWGFHHLRQRVAYFDLEMHIATLDLLDHLAPRHIAHR